MSHTATTGTSSLMALHSDMHKQTILSRFNALRKKDILCDITLVVEDVHFKAHKAFLAASSNYFSLMFTEEDQISPSTHRKLDGISAEMFAAVLEFIYSAQVCVEASATEQLLATARLLEVHDLVNVLTELGDSAPAAGGEGVHMLNLLKRKRGRPKKVIKPERSSAEIQAGDSNETESQLEGEEIKAPGVTKCRRGRPKKNVNFQELEDRTAPEEMVTGDENSSDEAEAQFSDYNPEDQRQSKRLIRPPLKFKSYKVGSDAAGNKEPGKRGRKRKYPNTEARCEECNKVFKNHLFLKIHQRTHTGNLPHPTLSQTCFYFMHYSRIILVLKHLRFWFVILVSTKV